MWYKLPGLFSKARNCAAVMAATTLVMSPVWADDTEIFFGDLEGGGAAPNVLFIMDTSGSMGNEDGTGRSRIDRVKDALKELLGSLNDVNVGLMRFSNPGGSVLYPVTYIDQATGHKTGNISTVSSVSGSESDAYQSTKTGTVTPEGADIRVGSVPSGEGEEGTIISTIDEPDEDAIEFTTNSVRLSSTEGGKPRPLYVYKDTYRNFGLRFNGLEIPPGSEILSASLELTVHGARRRVVARIRGDKPPAWRFKESSKNISNRANSSTSIKWNMQNAKGKTPANGEKITSPELKTLIQELVDDPDWEGDTGFIDDIILIIDHDSDNGKKKNKWPYRAFHTVETDPAKSARLTIRYSEGATVTEPHIAGMRFGSVDVPLNVTVTNAVIELNPLVTNDKAANLSISMEDADNPDPYSSASGDISGRSASGSLDWNSGAADWEADKPVQIDVTSLVNTHVKRGAWCGGDPMAFMLTGEDGYRIAHSFDSSSSDAPKLHVTYDKSTIVVGSSCLAITLRKRVVNDKDDGQSTGSGEAVAAAGNTIQVNSDKFGLFRFTDLDIPDNATVKSAYIKVYSGADTSGATNFSISIENAGNAGGISGADGVSLKSFIGGVPWSVTSDWAEGNAYTSPDIKGLINAVLGAGWNAKNSMLLKMTRSSGEGRTIYAHDYQKQTKAAQLIINYVDDGTHGADTVRDEMSQVVDSLSDDGYTPVQDTYYEAYQYYTGGDVIWGKFRGGHEANGEEMDYGPAEDGPFSYTRVSAEASIKAGTWGGRVLPDGCPGTDSSDRDCNDSNGSGKPKGEYLKGSPEYETPINNYCQSESHIIMLTDGIANEPHSESFIKSIDGISGCKSTSSKSSTNNAQKCVLELAELMHTGDMSDLEGQQKITTHTIGFNFSSDWLAEIAEVGGGTYKEADDAQSLVTEVEAILADVLKTDTSFVAPIAAINQFNRLTNLDDVYFAVFRPDDVPRWPGNLKRYKLKYVDLETNVLVDADGTPAVSDTTGFFNPDSRSYWSAEEDGSAVQNGGAASKFPAYGARNVYTYLGGSKDLSAAGNEVDDGNASLTAAILGVGDGDRDEQIDWIRGKDVDDEDGNGTKNENRYILGDPLHSKPVAITYNAPDPNHPGSDVSVFMATNGGAIHAISATDGQETFAFMPKDLLHRQVALRKNNSSQSHIYGIDGSITAWTFDKGNNGITPASGDYVRLYAGMRRGGRDIYALDATNRSSPKFMWQISGGADAGFEELGQTWSRPVKGRVKIDGEEPRDVLFFAGGYDPDKDSYSLKTADSKGRAVFIVDALTGALIWSGGPSVEGFTKQFADMKYSIPASLTVADTNSDGLDDIMFVGDTGGQLWRFDIKKDVTKANLVSGAVIGDFAVGGDEDSAKNRMFFNAPDVAMVNDGGKRKLAVTIGSGFRPHPLSKATTDQFFMVLQGAVYGPPGAYIKHTEDDLHDATENLVGQGSEEEKAAALADLNGSAGWFFDLPRTGEKVLSTPLTLRNTVTFATYVPSNKSDSCTPKAGTSYFFQLNLMDATPVNNWDTVDGLTDADRAYELNTPSIIDEPVIICTGDGCDLFTGAEKPPIDTFSSGNIIKTFWRQDQ